jgi:hypothetical protein
LYGCLKYQHLVFFSEFFFEAPQFSPNGGPMDPNTPVSKMILTKSLKKRPFDPQKVGQLK